MLRLANIRKSFGGVHALRDATLTLHAGEVTALIGENGAGKSTIVRIIGGLHQPDAGEIQLDGRTVRITDAHHARSLGISIVHQECVVFDNLSVAENICIHARPQRHGLVSWRQMRERAKTMLRQLDATFDPDLPAGRLSIAQKHIVQIARALDSDARVLVLDEPTAALSHREAEDLFRITRQLTGDGCAVLFISHRFEEVFSLAHRYSVFRDGAAVDAGRIDEVDTNVLVKLMVGRAVEPSVSGHAAPSETELLRVEGLSRRGEFNGISFSVRRGEVLGIYGLVGAGRSEVAHALFGLSTVDSGRILIDGMPVTIASPTDAVRHGLAYVPEDRQTEGAILSLSIAANVCLPSLQALAPQVICKRDRESAFAQKWIDSLSVKTPGPDQLVGALSGGNQQKVVLAKWLARQPRILIVDEPTKGIDVGAKAAVHAVMREFVAKGHAVVMISSELPEVLNLSDRVLVMRRGRARGVFEREAATPEAIVRAATDA
ncbi:rhamnose transport system ATP-binding protein [Povalibacter uvarum]|uniref:Rhamnose transport system ATP-binding protein n=1 Tax=Povalibacter uvarum TaxID=732238 RepID=A0A841HQ48_9GAMM|nr:sugar ABC transporter ATP-binding protein [Povalibacter uvarum]MBB6095471.1 rhamnose transport system ATP-binding protein [Povalibacter uvarum]